MIEFSYDAAYQPAMPVCSVTIASSAGDHRITCNAIIDTGADATIVPIRLLRHVGARRVFETGLRSHWGERRTVFLYLVDLEIDDVTLPALYAVGDELGGDVVLGRNALNRVVMLDGPRKLARVEA